MTSTGSAPYSFERHRTERRARVANLSWVAANQRPRCRDSSEPAESEERSGSSAPAVRPQSARERERYWHSRKHLKSAGLREFFGPGWWSSRAERRPHARAPEGKKPPTKAGPEPRLAALAPLIPLLTDPIRLEQKHARYGINSCQHVWRDHFMNEFREIAELVSAAEETHRGHIPFEMEKRMKRIVAIARNCSDIYTKKEEFSPKAQEYLRNAIPSYAIAVSELSGMIMAEFMATGGPS